MIENRLPMASDRLPNTGVVTVLAIRNPVPHQKTSVESACKSAVMAGSAELRITAFSEVRKGINHNDNKANRNRYGPKAFFSLEADWEDILENILKLTKQCLTWRQP